MSTNHVMLIVLKRAGEVVLKAQGHPAVLIGAGVGLGLVSIVRHVIHSAGDKQTSDY